MTIVLKSPLESHTLQELTVIGAIAIARGIVSSVGVEARVRWPNDVVVGERKLAGVLAESKLRGNRLAFALLGMGINANFHSFPVDGADKQPISLLDTVGSPIDRASVIASILLEVEQLLDRSRMDGEEPIMRMLRMSEASIGRHVRIELADHSICQGIIEEYESLTGLRILTRTGEHRTLDASSVLSVVYQD